MLKLPSHASIHTAVRRWITAASALMLLAALIIPAAPVHAAYTDDPMGYIDSCAVTADGYTVLFGWAHDASALTGAYPQVYVEVTNYGYFTVNTGIAGYRDAQVNSWVNSQFPGTPTGDTYGWVAYLSGLVKGGTYSLSGLVLNYGAGTNRPLYVNNIGNVDGDPAKAYFPGSVIPQSCIYTPPPPTPAPTATPTAPPTPAPTQSPTTTPTTPPTSQPSTPNSGSKPVVTAKPTIKPSAAAPSNATIVTPQQQPATPAAIPVSEGANLWTALNPNATSLDVTIFAKDAQMAELYFGSEANNLAKQGEQSLAANRAEFSISNLNPLTTYYYKIVSKNNDGSTTEGQVRTVNTKGYKLSVKFRANNEDVKGITVKIKEKNTTQTSPTETVVFHDLLPGSYTFEYTYQNKTYSTPVKLDESRADVDDIVSSVITIPVSSAAATKRSPRWVVYVVGGLIFLAGGAAAYLARRRHKQRKNYYSDYYTEAPAAETYNPEQSAQTDANQFNNSGYAEVDPYPSAEVPGAPHRGQSLKDMVLQSMGETAVKHHTTDEDEPKQPHSIHRPS